MKYVGKVQLVTGDFWIYFGEIFESRIDYKVLDFYGKARVELIPYHYNTIVLKTQTLPVV